MISASGCRLLSAIYTRREIKWDFYYAWDKALTVILCVSLTKILSGYSEDKKIKKYSEEKPVLKLNRPPTHTRTRTHQVTQMYENEIIVEKKKTLLIVFKPSNILPPGSDEDKKTRLSPLAASKREQETDSLQ